jgi:SEA/GATOR complex protein SEA2/WDR24
VRKLLVHCPTCGHGGHQACYREFYLTRPLTELPTHTAGPFPYGTTDSYSSTDTSTATYYSFSDSSEHGTRGEDAVEDDDDSEQDGSGGRGSDKDKGREELREYEASAGNNSERRPNMRILGHACAAGCGHWCWAANERFTGT